MASLVLQECSPLQGLAVPGRYGRRGGAAGLMIEERTTERA